MQQFNQTPILFSVGINHNTAPIEVREKLFVNADEVSALLDKLKETADEAVIVSTCNRTEIYAVTRRTDLDLDFYKDLLIDFKNAGQFARREDFFGLISCAACQQLFSVATGINSKIVGDTQILGQLRSAYHSSQNRQKTGKVLNQLFQRSFKVGKQSHTETNIHKGAVSVSLAAVELAVEIFGSLADKNVLIIGAGETAQMTANCLAQRKVKNIFVTNRTDAKTDAMLSQLNSFGDSAIQSLLYNDYKNHLNEIDIVISSTGANEPILTAADFAAQSNKILLIDIAMPRDIAPDVAECGNVTLRNIDDLHQIVDDNHRRRLADLPKVKRFIAHEMADFLVWYYSLPLLPEHLTSGIKPNADQQTEIVETKNFLLANVSRLHKMAMQNGAETFAGHLAVVSELAQMKLQSTQPRLELEA